MKSWKNHDYPTKDAGGESNGRIVRVWEEDVELAGYRPKQAYVTIIRPGMSKGPHLHMRRDSLFCCLSGRISVTMRDCDGTYKTEFSGEQHGARSIHVPAGVAARLMNLSGTRAAMVLNLSSGHYDPADEHEVTSFDR